MRETLAASLLRRDVLATRCRVIGVRRDLDEVTARVARYADQAAKVASLPFGGGLVLLVALLRVALGLLR